jgi:hypothetical protein
MHAERTLTGLLFSAIVLSSPYVASASTESLRLLETPSAWARQGGSERSFVFEDGQVTVTRGGAEPSALLTAESFENFELTFEFLLSKWCVSGLFIHAPRNGAYRAGLEIELSNQVHDPPDVYGAGAIFRKVPPAAITLREPYAWNTCSVRMDWPLLDVRINGVRTHYLDLRTDASLRHALRRGAIGFQNNGGLLKVRNLALERLADSEHGRELVPSAGLVGWTVVGEEARWANAGGVLRGADGNGYLLHETVCEDFDLRLYYRTSPNANGGVFFRWPPGETYATSSRGHEIQIYDAPGAVVGSGSIYHFDRGNDLAYRPEAWSVRRHPCQRHPVRGDRRADRGATGAHLFADASNGRLDRV